VAVSVEYRRVRVSSALSRSGLYDLDYAYNPYAGCAHGCLYCYARYYTPYREVAENWGRLVYVKENVVEVLKREVKKLQRGVVGVSTTTDPYQPVEELEMLARGGIEVLLSSGFKVSVQTKSPLVVRDLDILTRHRELVDVGFTITTLDDEIAKLMEPGAPPPSARASALRRIASEGVETWIFLGPIVRGVNDSEESVRKVVQLAAETGSKLIYDFLRLKPGLEKHLEPLERRFPGASTTPRWWREQIAALVERACKELGARCEPSFPPSKPPSTAKITDFT
jgi:DNA repair photolyase